MKRILLFVLLALSVLILLPSCTSDEFKVDKEYIVLRNGESESFTISGIKDYELIYDKDIVSIENSTVKFKKIGRTTVKIKVNIFTSTNLLTVDCTSFLGKGSVTEPYIIDSCEHFDEIRYFPNMNYVITNDLDFEGKSIDPIEEFTGNLDGENHVVKNFNFNDSKMRYVGLFSKVIKAVISNITIENSLEYEFSGYKGNVYGTEFYESSLGVLSGIIDESVVSNINVKGDIYVRKGESVGGIVGVLLNDASTLTNCFYNGSLSTSDSTYVGGIVGICAGDIAKSYGKGSVTVSDFNKVFVGGIVGKMLGDVENSFYEGDITISVMSASVIIDHKPINPSPSYAGLLVGHSNDGMIYESYAIGSISSYGDKEDSVYSRPYILGGIVGYSNGGMRYTFVACKFNISSVVKDYFTIGAAFGKFDGGNDFKYNFYDKSVYTLISKNEKELIDKGYLQGETTERLYHKDTYVFFDFNNIFVERTNYYPTLKVN